MTIDELKKKISQMEEDFNSLNAIVDDIKEKAKTQGDYFQNMSVGSGSSDKVIYLNDTDYAKFTDITNAFIYCLNGEIEKLTKDNEYKCVSAEKSIVKFIDEGGNEFVKVYIPLEQPPIPCTVTFDEYTLATVDGVTIVSGTELEKGTEVVFTAKVRENYEFVKWATGETENPLTVTLQSSSLYMSPEYHELAYTITFDEYTDVIIKESGEAIVSGAKIHSGTILTVSAKDKEGYKFVKWNNDMTEREFDITVDSDLYFKPEYEILQFKVEFSADVYATKDNEAIVSGTKFPYNTEIKFEPIGDTRFLHWEDESIAYFRTVQLTADVNAVPTFTPKAIGTPYQFGDIKVNEIDANSLHDAKGEYKYIELYNNSVENGLSLANLYLVKYDFDGDDLVADSGLFPLDAFSFGEDNPFIAIPAKKKASGNIFPKGISATGGFAFEIVYKPEKDSTEEFTVDWFNNLINTKSFIDFGGNYTLGRYPNGADNIVKFSKETIGSSNDELPLVLKSILGDDLTTLKCHYTGTPGDYDLYDCAPEGIKVKVKPANWDILDAEYPNIDARHMLINYSLGDSNKATADPGESKAKNEAKSLFVGGRAILLNENKKPDVFIPDDLNIEFFTVTCCGHKGNATSLTPASSSNEYLVGGGVVNADTAAELTELRFDILSQPSVKESPGSPGYIEGRPVSNYQLATGGAKVWAIFRFYGKGFESVYDADEIKVTPMTTIEHDCHELSGICRKDENTLYGVGDSGNLYTLDITSGVSELIYNSPEGRDFEAITLKDDIIYIADEGKNSATDSYICKYENGQLTQIGNVKLKTTDKDGALIPPGVEGFTHYKDDLFFIANQKRPNSIHIWDKATNSIVASTFLTHNYEVADLKYANNMIWVLDSKHPSVQVYSFEVNGENILSRLEMTYVLLDSEGNRLSDAENPEALEVDFDNNIMYIGSELGHLFTYNIKIVEERHTIEISSSDKTKGTVIGVSGSYNKGDLIPVEATAAEGCSFLGWYANGNIISNNPKYTFVVKNEDVALVGKFSKVVVVDNINEYSSLVEAWNSIQDTFEHEIKLNADVKDAGLGIFNTTPFVGNERNITLNLNGHTFKCIGPAVGSTGTETQALHLENGNTVIIKNGTIEVDENKPSENQIKMLVQNYCNLTLENVVLDGKNVDGANPYTLSNNFGNTKITGNTQILAKDANSFAFDLWYGMNSEGKYDNGLSVTFDQLFNGKVVGKVEYGAKSRITDADQITQKTKLAINSLNGDFSDAVLSMSSTQEGLAEKAKENNGIVIKTTKHDSSWDNYYQAPIN